jgi:hypothetical protein
MKKIANRLGPFAVLAAGPVLVGGLPLSHVAEGVVATLVMLGMMVPLVSIMLHPGTARPTSIVGGVDRRRPWLIAFSSLLFMLLLRYDSATTAVRAAMLVAGAAIALGLASDVRALMRLGRAMAGAERLRLRTFDSPPIDATTAIYDFGVGDDEREELGPPVAIYRERERVVRVVRGSRRAARLALGQWIAFDVAVVLPALLTIAALCTLRIYPY